MKGSNINRIKKRVNLIKRLQAEDIIRSSEVARAMITVPREMFLPKSVNSNAHIDVPLPIGFGQTISAPHMVAMMAEALELKVGHKIFEVGSGSGYHAAILAEIVSPQNREKGGHVYTAEIVPELYRFARNNLASAGYSERVTVLLRDGSMGCPEHAPYDRISVTAAAPKILKILVKELKIGGILIIPVGGIHFYQELIKVKKLSENKVSTRSLHSVAFVPLRGKNGWKT